MSHKSWRDHARPVIAAVLRETAGQDERAIKKALYDAYPFGERAMYPYKIYLDEVKRQRGMKKSKTRVAVIAAGQRDLFAEEAA